MPPDSLTVDLDRLYWTNKEKASVNSVLKDSGSDFITEHVKDAPSIIAYGKHLQPMPGILDNVSHGQNKIISNHIK